MKLKNLTIMALAMTVALSGCCGKEDACTGECKDACESECKDACGGQCGHHGTAAQFSKKLPVGVQLYSVRTDLEKDFYGTLKAIREMGYAGVEFYGEFYGNSAVQVKKWCTELGLIPFSSHVPYQEMIDNIDKVISDYTTIGVQYVAFPYMDEASRPGVNVEQFKKTVAQLGVIGKKVNDAGFQLLYHNHDFEFADMGDGKLGYDYIFSSNEPKNLKPEIDVCWVSYSGQDPVAYINKFAGNTPVIHLKDYYLEGKLSSAPYALIGISTDNSMKDEGGWFEYRPLGMGQVDIPAVINAAAGNGAQWLCVEQDEPCQGMSRLDGVKKSAEYLRALGLM